MSDAMILDESSGDISASISLAAARGYSLILWGVLTSLSMLGGIVRIDALDRLAIPLHASGCALGVAGAWILTRRAMGPLRAESRLRIAALANVYFLPLVAWWRRTPYSAHLVMNTFLAACAAAWFLVEVCRQSGRTARALGDGPTARESRREWRISAALSGMTLAALLLRTLYRSLTGDASLFSAWDEALRYSSGWMRMLALTPFPISLLCAWRSRGLCLRVALSAPPGVQK